MPVKARPASHGLLWPPGSVVQTPPSANTGSDPPYRPHGPSDSANEVCGRSSTSEDSDTSSRQNVQASGLKPPSWKAIWPSGSSAVAVAG